MYLEEAANFAQIATAFIALFALVVAGISICSQKSVARKQAAIDAFVRTEMDKDMLDAYLGYTGALDKLKEATSIEDFSRTPEYQSIRTYLNINELIATGINHKVFDEDVCRSFWYNILTKACCQAEQVIQHAREELNGECTYDQLLRVNKKWAQSSKQSHWRLPNGLLRIVAKGEKSERTVVAEG